MQFAGPADRQKTKKLCVYKCITSTGQPQRVINDEIFNRLKGAGFTGKQAICVISPLAVSLRVLH